MGKIVISGYYGFGNMGDEALLAGIIKSLKRINSGLAITVLSANPEETARLYGVNAIGRYNAPLIFRELLSSEMFLSGGGSLFQDITGWKTVPYYSLLVFWARLLGKKIVFYAQGLGPLERRVNRFLVQKAVSMAEYISVRDKESQKLLEELDVDREQIYKTADPVFSFRQQELFSEKKNFFLKAEKIVSDLEKPIIGISVRPWKNNEYLQEFIGEVKQFAATIGASIVIIPMHYDIDYALSSRLSASLDIKNRILPRVEDPRQLLAFFSKLDFVIGLRLHSLVFAAFNCVPFLGLAYDPKVSSFVKNYNDGEFIDINDFKGIASLNGLAKRIWENRDRFIEELKKKKESFFQLNQQHVHRINNLL